MIKDVILDEIQRVRKELIEKYGGLDGWIDHLQEMDREREAKAKNRTKKKPAATAAKSRRKTAKSKS